MRVYVFKTHHNIQFSPQMLQNKINESPCLQNPPQSSVFTTKASEQNQRESMSSNPTTIFSFHHKCYITKSMKVCVFKTHHNLHFSPQCYKNKTHHNLQFSPQMLHYKINEGICLQNLPQSSVFTTNATEQNQ